MKKENMRNAQFITMKELLNRVPVSRVTIHNWITRGKIPFIKIKGKLLFHWDSVESAIMGYEINKAMQ